MPRTMLIAPYEGAFAATLAAAARAAGWRTALAVPGLPRGEEGPVPQGSAPDRAEFPWNPASYVSAGALALSVLPVLGEPEALVLLCDTPASGPSLFAGPPGSLGSSLQAAVDGPAFLLRELVRRLDTAKGGRILLISVEAPPARPEASAPGSAAFASLVQGAFRGLGEGLFDRARGASWSAWGIQDRSGRPEAAVDFALRLLEEQKPAKSGRWLPFNGKAGIFGVF